MKKAHMYLSAISLTNIPIRGYFFLLVILKMNKKHTDKRMYVDQIY